MKKLIYGLLALVILIGWCGSSFLPAWKRDLLGEEKSVYKIVCLGDSIFGQIRGETSITHIMEEILQEKIFNGAFGGSNMSRLDNSRSLAYPTDGLSMAALAQAIGYDDFRVQRNVKIEAYGNGTEYFGETLEMLSGIDFQQVEVLFIEHGANDYHAEIPLINSADVYDTYTFGGALRMIIETLRERFPSLRIILVTPTYSWSERLQLTCEEWNTGHGYLEDYVNLEIQIAEEYGIEVIDNYHDFYPHEEWEDLRIYTTDGLHPNEAGREKIARRLADYLLESGY